MTSAGIQIHLFAAARAAIGSGVVDALPGSLKQVLDALEVAHPRFSAVRPRCSYLVDGMAAHGDPALTFLAPGGRLDVLPPFAGG